ncbi:uncharacterized protein LOC128720766 [Anopheles nili]|uniref:uncharacterized protein LOC128720766 n=1 Tax=Anopheles nili TaxID=185578 RepID=UPI00237C3167|nr:uncharacterized protein LOC128720766 [Anopheles nili]
MFRFLVLVGALSVFCHNVLTTSCPFCIGVDECESNQSIPKVTCTASIVNQTVTELSVFYEDLTEFTAIVSVYSCVDVKFRIQGHDNNAFAVQGCTAGQKSICSQPTFDINGSLNCSSRNVGHSMHRPDSVGLLSRALLSLVAVIGAFAVSS